MGQEKSRTIFLSEGKIARWQEDYLHNFIIFRKYLICASLSQTIWKWDHENLGNLWHLVSSSSLKSHHLSSTTSVKTIVKARDPGDEVENEVNNTEIFVNFLLFCKLSSGLGFNARMLCNFVSRSFPLFDMQKYWFCRVLPHVN